MGGRDPGVPPNFAGPYWPGGLTEQFHDPGAVLSSWAGTNGAHILAPADGAFLTPRARQAPEEETACCIFLAPSPAVGFGYAITWALFLSRPGCVLLSPGLWNLPSDLPFLLAAEPAGVHAQSWELHRCQDLAL